ncbi:class I SAM-dependent methyltransferase [Methanobacterium sp. ACI-7]|uniref:class I SAM-dependent methyltransferase n=1 Tax=unclassified Methanobacterium TaxID=2627676 RepID=UPI0039C3914D
MKGKVIGDILLLKNEPANLQELLDIPEVKRIVKIGRINGPKRKPDVQILVGNNTETIHRENHCFYKLDVAKIMWSKGNTTERMRIGNIVNDGEIVVDMFAGIGYFSIPMAVHSNPEKIYSIEINPVSYGYLKENVVLNKVEGIIEPILGDCREVAPKKIANRVHMGYIGNTHEYLDAAMEIVKPGGIIHYHESVPDLLKFKRPPQRIIDAAGDRDVEILKKRIIKKYSPGVYHVVIDAKIN